MKRILTAIICALIVIAIPLIGLPVYACVTPDVYGNTYLAAMADKYERLHSVKGAKIVLIGGSSMAFGVDSAKIEKELGMPVVNMALYAALGSKTTLDLSLSGIDDGDIVVFAPEMDTQAYSLYTSPEIMMQTLEANRSMIKRIPVSEWVQLYAELPNYITTKKKLYASGIPNPENAYSRAAFNSYGDNVYERKYNIMPDLYLTSNMISITDELLDGEFIDYVNDYADQVNEKGASFYFSFPPMNRLALTEESTYESRLNVYTALTDKLECEIIGNIEDHIMHEGYFYDSNYHLNESGIPYNTRTLVGDIKRQMGDTSPINIQLVPPSGAELVEAPELGDDANAVDFELVEETSGWAVVAVSRSALSKRTLTVPQSYQGKAVVKIKSGAFAGSSADTINIGENITTLENGIFEGCYNLRAVNLSVKLGAKDSLPIVGSGLIDGAPSNLVIYVPASKYPAMCTDYFWTQYTSVLDIAN